MLSEAEKLLIAVTSKFLSLSHIEHTSQNYFPNMMPACNPEQSFVGCMYHHAALMWPVLDEVGSNAMVTCNSQQFYFKVFLATSNPVVWPCLIDWMELKNFYFCLNGDTTTTTPFSTWFLSLSCVITLLPL